MPFLSCDVRVRALNVTRECCCDLGHLAEVFASPLGLFSPVSILFSLGGRHCDALGFSGTCPALGLWLNITPLFTVIIF